MDARTRFSQLGSSQIIWFVIGGLFLLYGVTQIGALTFLSAIVALLAGITVHECAHAWAADQLGDPTARQLGRISLNPIVHLDPLGTLMMAITTITGMGIGWGKPVPIVPYRLRYGRRLGAGLVALAGPLSNLLFASLLGLLLRLGRGLLPVQLAVVLYTVLLTNVVLAMFNLLPVPPLDGHSVLLGVLSLFRGRWAWQASNFLDRLASQGPMALILLIIASQFLGLNIIGVLIGPPMSFIVRIIMGAT